MDKGAAQAREGPANSMATALRINGLTKRYQDFALENFNLSLQEGSCVGLIGENGAGKSTLIKSILGLVRLDGGQVQLFGGGSIIEGSDLIREHVGYVPEDQILYEWMTIRQTIKFYSAFYRSWDLQRSTQLLRLFHLTENQKVAHLSKGMKVKLLLVLALSHQPSVLLLDEPTGGLDPLAKDELIDYLEQIRKDQPRLAILISSHILSDIEVLATEIAILREGRLILWDQKEVLRRSHKVIHWHSPETSMVGRLIAAPFVIGSAYENGILKLLVSVPGAEGQRTLEELAGKGAQVVDATVGEIYLGLMRHKIRP